MATTNFTNSITLTDAAWFDDADTAVYSTLSSVSGVDTITATGPTSMSGYAAGQVFKFVSAGANTGAVTLNITPSGGSALGAKAITKDGTTALVAGDIVSGALIVVGYDGTRFQLLSNKPNTVPNGGTGLTSLASSRIPYGDGTSAFQSSATFTFDGTTLGLPGQIAFPATQAASSGANTLDDYEEGTWTPNATGDGGGSSQTYTTQTGAYTKIGNLVIAEYTVTLSAAGTITGNFIIDNLPFTSRATTLGINSIGNWSALATNWVWLTGFVNSNSTKIYFQGRQSAGTAATLLVQADISNTTRLEGVAIYLV